FIQQHPFYYHDKTKKFLVYYIPEDESPEEIIAPAQLAADLEGYTLRYVTELPDFVETVHVFEDGLNDIVIQLLKGYICLHEMQFGSAPPTLICYNPMYKDYPGGDGWTLSFEKVYDIDDIRMETLSQYQYMLIYNRCKELNILCPDKNTYIRVDDEYVLSILNN
ncbi:MAG: hypothetical protein GX133_03875, partial [Syntrophomonadaceae bacterium]|nr:hypothetical protein [Syntrophomonadaceae bacterium]